MNHRYLPNCVRWQRSRRAQGTATPNSGLQKRVQTKQWAGLESLEPRILLNVVADVAEAAPAIEAVEAVGPRIIEFADLDWVVKSSDAVVGPGPNLFSDSQQSVWVDTDGLHLKIRYEEDAWYSAEVYSAEFARYGMHRFYVDARVDQLDKNVVLGLFVYEGQNKEIDLEFTRWGQDDPGYNSQYVVHPSGVPGNRERFTTSLNGSWSTHYFNWQPDSIQFKSFHDHSEEPFSEDHLIHEWLYEGGDIPAEEDGLRIHMNLWLNLGQAPFDGQEVEVIIRDADLPNLPPVIGGLMLEPVLVCAGGVLSLTATDVLDPNGVVGKVEFYRDHDMNGIGAAGEKIGEDINGSDGWVWSGIADWPTGDVTFLAQATDDEGAASVWSNVTGTVGQCVTIGDSPLSDSKSVLFTDKDGSSVTLKVRKGSATVAFTGDVDIVLSDNGRLHAGNGVYLAGIDLLDTSPATTLTIKVKGGKDRLTEIGSISGSSPIGKIIGKRVNVTGSGIAMTDDGYVRSLRLHDVLNGADILMEGEADEDITVKVGDVGTGSEVKIERGPVRKLKFKGTFSGVLSTGVERGADGVWFTSDDFVATQVPVRRIVVKQLHDNSPNSGVPYGLLLGPLTRKVTVAGWADGPNEAASIDGEGFELRALPGSDPQIAIRSVKGRGYHRSVNGNTTDIPTDGYKVLLYAKTDKWYIQPFVGVSLKMNAKGEWQTVKVKPGELYAWVVRRDFEPGDILNSPLDVDGQLVVAETVWAAP